MNNKYTSLKLSKLLKKYGCELKSEYAWQGYRDVEPNKDEDLILEKMESFYKRKYKEYYVFKAYDLLRDICVKYPKEFFGYVKINCVDNVFEYSYALRPKNILRMLQQGDSQKEIEDYIWLNCLFNPKNKEK